MNFDNAFARAAFPALKQDFVFMDNAGGSQILGAVMQRVQEYWTQANVQHGASYEISQRAMRYLAEGKAAMQLLLNAKDPNELVMGGSSTLLLRILSLSILKTLQPGDEIIVSTADHEANVSPWTDLEKEGIVIKKWAFSEDSFLLEPNDLKKIISPKTKYVACCHCSNILGGINDIPAIAEVVHAADAKLIVDGVAYAPHRLVDVQALNADFYIYSLYKTFGPHYAVMYGKMKHWEQLPGLNHYFIPEDKIPYKLEPGGENYELVYGMTGLTDYLQSIALHHGADKSNTARQLCQLAYAHIAAYESQLSESLLQFLNAKSNVRIIGPTTSAEAERVSTIAFVVEGKKSDELVKAVDAHKIGIRFGDFYAKKIIEQLQLANYNGVVRVSMVHYNSMPELERLMAVFEGLF